MDFTRYSLDDFLLDESFQAFVADADSEAGRFWQAWLREHPEKQAEAAQAQGLLQGLYRARPTPVPSGLKQQEWQRLRQARRSVPAAAPQPWLRSRGRARRWVAALATLMLLVSLGWWQWQRPGAPASSTTRYATGKGQQRTLTLPDGSVVKLNENSTLTTAARWEAATPREVWLSGEGYFQVTHRAPASITAIQQAPANLKFVVHAGQLNVSVLGTQFDVNSRRGSTKVVLSSGKVAVERQALLTRETLLLQPGDLVETSAAQPGLMRRRVQPALYSAWSRGQLEFKQTSVRDIVQLLRDAYDLQVEVTDPAILQQLVTGGVPATSPEVLLPALAKSLDLQVTRSGNTVRLAPAAR